MVIKKELIMRQIAGETILVPVGKTVYDSNGLFVMNDVAAFIWEQLPALETAQEICDAVLREYAVAPEVAMGDVEEFLAKLRALDVI